MTEDNNAPEANAGDKCFYGYINKGNMVPCNHPRSVHGQDIEYAQPSHTFVEVSVSLATPAEPVCDGALTACDENDDAEAVCWVHTDYASGRPSKFTK